MHPLAKRTLRLTAGGLAAACTLACSSAPPAGSAAGAGGGAGSAASARGISCAGMDGSECENGDCCASLPVPGGTFGQGQPDAFSATVSSFVLDRYEVSVARFRTFAAAYDAWRAAGNPTANSGANAHVPGSGWDPSWNDALPADADALTTGANVECGNVPFQTWSTGHNDTLPINCVDWYTSFAFCIWDGGRLPTESEWEYAAASGENDTLYPWGDTPAPDNTFATANLAVYDCLGNGDPDCVFSDILPVGSRPDGNGRFGQSDLAGSVWEWVLDWTADYPMQPQTDYARTTPDPLHLTRMIRGGDFSSPANTLPAAARYSYGYPYARFTNVGFRCAANP